jgi:hypothetical protein
VKKKAKKLMLRRETVTTLDIVVGGLTRAGACETATRCSNVCPDDGGSGSWGTCISCGVCSGGCATGGACTT